MIQTVTHVKSVLAFDLKDQCNFPTFVEESEKCKIGLLKHF